MGHRGMRATGGTRDAGGEAFGSGHLKRCLGSRGDLPFCAPPGAFGTPGLRKEVSLREAAAGGVGGAGGGEIFFPPVFVCSVCCRVRTNCCRVRTDCFMGPCAVDRTGPDTTG